MRISFEDLSSVVERMSAVEEKNSTSARFQSNALITYTGEALMFSYCNGGTDLYQVVNVLDYMSEDIYETDDNGNNVLVYAKDPEEGLGMCVSYTKLKEVVSIFKPTGTTKASAVTVCKEVRDGSVVPNSLVFKCVKYVEVKKQEEDVSLQIENNESVDGVEGIGSYEQTVRWDDTKSSYKLDIYNRVNISDALINENDNEDVWEASEFRDIVSRLSADNNRLTLISAARGVGYVDNTSNALMFKLEDKALNNTLVLTQQLDAKLISLLAKWKGNVRVAASSEDMRFKLCNDDNTLAFFCTTSKAPASYIAGMNNCSNIKAKDVQCTLYTDGLKDIVNNISSILSSKGDATVGAKIIVEPQGEARMVFDDVKTASGNSKNKFSINIQSYRTSRPDKKEIKVKLPLISIQKVLANIKTHIVAFDMEFADQDGKAITLRIAETSEDRQTKAITEAMNKYKADNGIAEDDELNPADVLTNDDMLELRKSALGMTGFIPTKAD